MSESVEDMMAHLDTARQNNDESVDTISSCANCQKPWAKRNKTTKITQSDHPSSTKCKKCWTNTVCPDCGRVYEYRTENS